MAPVNLNRRTASSLPTLLSLSKLIHVVPNLVSEHVKRDQFVIATSGHGGKERVEPGSPDFYMKLAISMTLVVVGGVFAGLTLALMGSDDLNLKVLAASSSDPSTRRSATKVLRLLKRGRHWVLVVLLLSNVLINESLPIMLDPLLGGGPEAVIVSTIMIVIFGEVIPQAICVRYGLEIGGACSGFVWAMMIVFAPIAWPIAKLLDYVLGTDEGHTYKKAELKSFLQFHREGEEPLRDDEIVILNGVLSLNDRRVDQIMTPIQDCLTLSADEILDSETIQNILISGFSRIPVHEPHQPDNFIGMLLVKRLITYNPEEEWPVSKFPLNALPEAKPDLNCFQALDYFQTGRAHLLLISDTPGQRGGALGVISLEDLIEEIIGEEIIDETDRYQDNHSKRKAQRKATGAIMRGIIERQRVINAFSRRPSGTSRNHSPHPSAGTAQPREGILVQIHDEPNDMSRSNSVNVASPEISTAAIISSPLANTAGSISIIATSPNGMVEAPIAAIEAAVENADIVETEAGDPKDGGEPIAQASQSENITPEELKGGQEPAKPSEPESSSNGGPKKTNGKPNSDVGAFVDFQRPFSQAEFVETAQAFVAKYDGLERVLGPERTNAGWEWRSKFSLWRGTQGYLYRRSRRVLPSPAGAETPEAEMEEEEEEDDAAAAVVAAHAPTVEVELDVAFSESYGVPLLCIRAWDEHGVPLPLETLVSVVMRAHLPVDEQRRRDALMLPGAPFPLLQQTEHPVTGDMVWSVHPCEVSNAVHQILVAEGEESALRSRLSWLEAWFMLSDSIVDLTS
ncbi:Protein MAM3 [Vanrija pseudolonga]|uniref:Protein MAM3 n=1 Tax=Vanrija pseudolonga TaxID=143232 RepID=A0AAF0YH67_9TREE|nr:Protein MAM3 [Vanrija pseudolonga]